MTTKETTTDKNCDFKIIIHTGSELAVYKKLFHAIATGWVDFIMPLHALACCMAAAAATAPCSWIFLLLLMLLLLHSNSCWKAITVDHCVACSWFTVGDNTKMMTILTLQWWWQQLLLCALSSHCCHQTTFCAAAAASWLHLPFVFLATRCHWETFSPPEDCCNTATVPQKFACKAPQTNLAAMEEQCHCHHFPSALLWCCSGNLCFYSCSL